MSTSKQREQENRPIPLAKDLRDITIRDLRLTQYPDGSVKASVFHVKLPSGAVFTELRSSPGKDAVEAQAELLRTIVGMLGAFSDEPT